MSRNIIFVLMYRRQKFLNADTFYMLCIDPVILKTAYRRMIGFSMTDDWWIEKWFKGNVRD
jgi:hypothetical protein